MNIVRKLLSLGRKTFKEGDISKMPFAKHFLIDYKKQYAQFLEDLPYQEVCLSELFLFRSWTTQFGFRIFNSFPEFNDSIIYHALNQAILFGRGGFKIGYGIDIESVLGGTVTSIVSNRWQAYDAKVEQNKERAEIPTRMICAELMERCLTSSPSNYMWICSDFITNLDQLKKEAISIGLLQ